MDLALLVYAISLLQPVNSALSFVGWSSCFLVVAGLFISLISQGDREGEAIWAFVKPKIKWFVALFVVAGTLQVFIPKEKTAYMMVGAYTAQKIAQDPKVEQVGAKVMTILNQKLDSYVDEGIEQAEKAAKKKLAKEETK